MKPWNARSEIFRTMPIRSFFTFCLAVACTFAAVGVVNDLFDLEHSDVPHLILRVLTTSGFAVLWVLVIHKRTPRLLILVACAQALWMIVAARLLPSPNQVFTVEQWRTHVILHGLLILVLILFSYGWFGTFFQIEGKRYFAAHTEIELASRIQQQLVPPIQAVVGNVEAYGVSNPSGTVGGDLIDLVEAHGLLYAYVADVAGHGVAAGVMMSMVKTAVRMHFMATPPAGKGLLEAVNDTLAPLTESSAYATFAYLLISPEMQVIYSVAAHLPIFHLRHKDGTVLRHSVENLPVAIFPGTRYQTATIDFQPGDILAIVTDGLTEVFDSKGNELGDAYIESALVNQAALPLAEIAAQILHAAKAFGKTTDDQTLLLLRRQASAHTYAADGITRHPTAQ
jgi:hypothetical protein